MMGYHNRSKNTKWGRILLFYSSLYHEHFIEDISLNNVLSEYVIPKLTKTQN